MGRKKEVDIKTIKSKIMGCLFPYLRKFCLHENFCRECSCCRNVVAAISKIRYLGGKDAAAYSIFQHEWNIKCISLQILGKQEKCGKQSISSEEVERRIEYNPEYRKWKEEKEQKQLRIPDYEKTFEECGDKQIDLLYNEKIGLKQAQGELIKKCPANILYDYVKYALDFYVDLYICQKISCYQNMKPKKERDADWDQYLANKEKDFVKKYAKYEEFAYLIEDCFLQFTRMYEDITELDYYPDAYYKQFKNPMIMVRDKEKEGFYHTAALRYVDAGRYVPYLSKKTSVDSPLKPEERSEYIDAYTDLYFFKLLKEEMDKNEKDKDNQK